VIAIRFLLVVVTVFTVSTWPLASFLIFWLLVVILLPQAFRNRAELARLRRSEANLIARLAAAEEYARLAAQRDDQVGEVQRALDETQRRVRRLEKELERAQAKLQQTAQGHPAFRRVGLDPSCARWLAESARRGFRQRLHPDRHQDQTRKAEAQKRFVEAEQVFAEIFELRGWVT
jgi:hypothetical protein